MRSNVERDSRGREKSSIIRREKEIVILVSGTTGTKVGTWYGTETMRQYLCTPFFAQHKKQDAYFNKEKKKENVIDAVLSRQAR